MQFDESDIAYLQSDGQFSRDCLNSLRAMCFTGDVWAVPEGTAVFPNEPLLQIVAPLPEAQIVETYVLNQMHFQSLVASKASRVVEAADGRTVAEFGSRRAHGIDAALKVAKASYIAGAVGTSNVLAGKIYGIPTFGTMAHSFIQAHDDELQAFRAFVSDHPDTTLLVDTYDTIAGVENVITLRQEMGDRFRVRAIRLDSGDLLGLSQTARSLLDRAGLRDVEIFASGGLDEYAISELGSAPIDGFGVGTRLAVCHDEPDMDFVYKLVEFAGRPRFKRSTGKELLPGRKQVFRQTKNGEFQRDVLGGHNQPADGAPLLRPVMRGGRRLNAAPGPDLERVRGYVRNQVEALPSRLRKLERAEAPYPVLISSSLK